MADRAISFQIYSSKQNTKVEHLIGMRANLTRQNRLCRETQKLLIAEFLAENLDTTGHAVKVVQVRRTGRIMQHLVIYGEG